MQNMHVRAADAGTAHTNEHLAMFRRGAAALDHGKRVRLLNGYRDHGSCSMTTLPMHRQILGGFLVILDLLRFHLSSLDRLPPAWPLAG